MSSYKIVYPDELNHYGVKGMRWGHRKQIPLVGRRPGGSQNPQMDDAQRRSIQKQRAKKAAIIGGSIVAAGLVAYGGYKLRSSAVTSLAKKYEKKAISSISKANEFKKFASEHGNLADKSKLKAGAVLNRPRDAHNDAMYKIYKAQQDSNLRTARTYDKVAKELMDDAWKYRDKAKNNNFTNKEIIKEAKNILRDKYLHR